MTDNRQKVLQQIDANKDKSLKFLQKIVSIPSVTGDEGAIQKFLADYLTKMGLEVDMWETDWEALKKHPGYIPVDRGYEGRPNIVATWKGTGGGKSLLFNGHTDVIAGAVAGTRSVIEEVTRLMRVWGPAIDPHAASVSKSIGISSSEISRSLSLYR